MFDRGDTLHLSSRQTLLATIFILQVTGNSTTNRDATMRSAVQRYCEEQAATKFDPPDDSHITGLQTLLAWY